MAMKNKWKIIGMLLVLFVIAGLASARSILAIFNKKEEKKKVADIVQKVTPRKYDEKLIVKLDQALSLFTRNQYTISGRIDMLNKADTSEHMHNVFFICRNGNNFYYKMGEIEQIVNSGICLDIDNNTKRVFAKSNKITDSFKIVDVAQLKQALLSEQYDLVSSEHDNLKTISLKNEHHITCKEYSVTFDTVSNKLAGIKYRLTYFKDPLNINKEKDVNITISQCDTIADAGHLYELQNKIIDPSGRLTTKYSGYKLIRL